jgi:putative transposase
VSPRLSAVERIRAQIDQLFASDQELGQVLEEVARLSVRLVMQAALEAEVTEFFGRDRYQRGERERVGYRNGHTELTVKTTAGPVVLERPKVRATSQPFVSRLLGKGVSRTDERFKARGCCRPAGTGLASWSGVVDPGAKSRVVGL